MRNKELIFALIAFVVLTSCHKAPAPAASPVGGEVYRSLDGQRSLTLTSPEDCEFRDGSTTLSCKYTKEPEGLHVVNGTDEVGLFRFTAEGIQRDTDPVLLSTQRYEAEALEKRAAKERDDLLK